MKPSLIWAIAGHTTSFAFSAADWTVGQSVETSSGTVGGHAAPNATKVSEYLGIPFAEPPVGNLRWKPPVKYTGTSPVNGTHLGHSCWSLDSQMPMSDDLSGVTVAPGAPALIPLMATPPGMSEDCLTLNIWTKPQTGDRKKAVLVFIHGGSLTSGSSSVPVYDGQVLADEQDVVVVTINYRLNIFGFPGNPTEPYNLGLLDQRLAIEWVRDNVESFGGDSSRITLFGQSAGGWSVDLYGYAYAKDPIVHGLAVMSGNAVSFGRNNASVANMMWSQSVGVLGCNSTKDAILECMQKKPVEDVMGLLVPGKLSLPESGARLPFPAAPSSFFVTVPDEEVVFTDYTSRTPAPIPALVGMNDREADFFILAAPNISDSTWRMLETIIFGCPAAVRANWSLQHGNPTWRYRWFGDFPNLRLTSKPASGAWHTSELLPLFGTSPQSIIEDTPEQVEISKYLRGAWAAFAKDPKKGLLSYGGGWPQYSPDEDTLIRLAYENRTGTNLAKGNFYDESC